MPFLNQAGILIGSNIDPESNLLQAISLLSQLHSDLRISSAWESASVGFDGPNFLNAAVLVNTNLNLQSLNQQILRPLEGKLGRQRQNDKFAPRTIDLDIVVWNHEPVSDEIWQHAHASIPTSQVLPDLRFPASGETLSQIAQRLAQNIWIKERADILNPSLVMA